MPIDKNQSAKGLLYYCQCRECLENPDREERWGWATDYTVDHYLGGWCRDFDGWREPADFHKDDDDVRKDYEVNAEGQLIRLGKQIDESLYPAKGLAWVMDGMTAMHHGEGSVMGIEHDPRFCGWDDTPRNRELGLYRDTPGENTIAVELGPMVPPTVDLTAFGEGGEGYADDSLSPQLKPEEGVEYYLDMSNFTTLAFQCSTNVPKLTISIYSTLQNDGTPPANCEYVKVYEGGLIKGDFRSGWHDLGCKFVKVVLRNASAFEGEASLFVRRCYQKEREEEEMPKFKEGDKVRVVAIDQGWGNWVPEMSQFMGKVFRARLVDSLGVVFTEGLIGGESGYAFPPHVLQPADIDPGFKEGDKVRIVGPSFMGYADHIGKTGVLAGEADAEGDYSAVTEDGYCRAFSPASLELIASKDDEKEEEGCIICGGEPDPCRRSTQKLFGGAACNACVQAWQNSAGRAGVFYHMNGWLRDHGFTSRDQVSLEDVRKAYRETGGFKQETGEDHSCEKDEGFSFCYDLAHSSEDQKKMVETQNKSLGHEETSWLKAKLPDGRIVESPIPSAKDGWEEVWSDRWQEGECGFQGFDVEASHDGAYPLQSYTGMWIGDKWRNVEKLLMHGDIAQSWIGERFRLVDTSALCILEAKKYRRKIVHEYAEGELQGVCCSHIEGRRFSVPLPPGASHDQRDTAARGVQQLARAINKPNPNWPSDTGHPVLTSGDGPRKRKDPYPILSAEPPRPEYDDTYWPQRHAPRR